MLHHPVRTPFQDGTGPKPTLAMKKTPLFIPIAASLLAGLSFAQQPDGPNPARGGAPPSADQPEPPGPKGTGPRGAGPRAHRPFAEQMKQRLQGARPLEKMSEAERGRLRRAMEQVWNADQVKAARDSAWEAAKNYREALRNAVLAADPEVRPLLERILVNGGPENFGPGGPNQQPPPGLRREGIGPRMPQPGTPGPGGGPPPLGEAPAADGPPPQGPPDMNEPRPAAGRAPGNENVRPGKHRPDGPPRNGGDPDAGQPPAGKAGENRRADDGGPRAGMHLPAEVLEKLTEEQRKQFREAMQTINQLPAIVEARKAAQAAEGDGKREAARKVRELVKETMDREFPELAKALAEIRGAGSGEKPQRPRPDRSGKEPSAAPPHEGAPQGPPPPDAPGDPPPPPQ